MQWFPDYSRWSSTRLRAIGRFLASLRLTCCCLSLRQVSQLLPARGGYLQLGVFGIFLSRASAISPVASPLGGRGTFCTSVVKERVLLVLLASSPLLSWLPPKPFFGVVDAVTPLNHDSVRKSIIIHSQTQKRPRRA